MHVEIMSLVLLLRSVIWCWIRIERSWPLALRIERSNWLLPLVIRCKSWWKLSLIRTKAWTTMATNCMVKRREGIYRSHQISMITVVMSLGRVLAVGKWRRIKLLFSIIETTLLEMKHRIKNELHLREVKRWINRIPEIFLNVCVL